MSSPAARRSAAWSSSGTVSAGFRARRLGLAVGEVVESSVGVGPVQAGCVQAWMMMSPMWISWPWW